MTTIEQLQEAANKSVAKIKTTSERLQPFCQEPRRSSVVRREITKPFSYGRHSYGTDGRIMVRMKRDPSIPEAKDMPDVDEKVMLRIAKAAREYCNKIPKKGYQSVNIPTLKSVKPVLGARKVKVRDRVINLDFLHKIRHFPNLKLHWAAGGEMEPLAFIFDGGCGLVMPIRVPDVSLVKHEVTLK